jgi:hypothetical protein
MKVAYVSFEVSTKDRVSLDPKPRWTITKIWFSFTLSNLHEWEGNTNFLRFTITLVTLEEHLVRLGDKSPRVTNTQRSLVQCFAWRLRGSLKGWLKSLLGSLDWSEAWRREDLSSRSVGSKGFQVSGVAKRAKGCGPPFITLKRNLPIGVSKILTCPTKGPYMFEKGYWNPTLAPNMSDIGT